MSSSAANEARLLGNACVARNEFEAAAKHYSQGIRAIALLVPVAIATGSGDAGDGDGEGGARRASRRQRRHDAAVGADAGNSADIAPDEPRVTELDVLAEKAVSSSSAAAGAPADSAKSDDESDSDDDDESDDNDEFDIAARRGDPEVLPEGVTLLSDAGSGPVPESRGNEPARPLTLLGRDTSRDEAVLKKRTLRRIPADLRSSTAAPLFCNRSLCYAKLSRWRDALDDAVVAFALDPSYAKALLRSAQAREQLDQLRAALDDYETAAKIDASLEPTMATAKHRLEPKIAEQQERDKAEMLGQLKDVGNKFLGLFGLSTNNFKFTQGEGGGYNVSFQQ